MISDYISRVAAFKSIKVHDVKVQKRRISGTVSTTARDGKKDSFRLIFTYSEDIDADTNTAGLILTMPVINYTYFSEKLELDFPVSSNDISLIKEFLRINAREVFINKICRRRYEFFRKEFIPEASDITPENADGRTILIAEEGFSDSSGNRQVQESSLVLSSGGKESLLTFGMLNELNLETHAYFFNESGGHWRTAKTSYDHFKEHYRNVSKVWSNADRFYRFMIERLEILDMGTVRKRADTYPIRLFIFPVYIFASLPIVTKHGIGNILMGNEFDDPREMPLFNGMKHYYGVFDQSSDFTGMMTEYFEKKGVPSRVWSAVYPISGLVVEEILVKRYHDLFLQQRSCHSCSYRNGSIRPCGICTKCLGVMMFVLSAGGNPEDILYDSKAVENLEANVMNSRMRLDSDELAFLKNRLWGESPKTGADHAGGIHILPWETSPLEKVPENAREGLKNIFKQYCSGTYSLKDVMWRKESG